MASTPARSIDNLPFPTTATGTPVSGQSPVEQEVIALFDEFRDPVFRYTLSFGVSMHDGEEVTQEVFLALFRHFKLGKSQRNLRSWIFRVAHNLALKRRSAVQRTRDLIELNWQIVERQRDPSPSPEDQVASDQKQERLLAIFRVLPEEDQHCLRLRSEGLRYREIAEVLGMSLGAVSISLTRSLGRLLRADGMP